MSKLLSVNLILKQPATNKMRVLILTGDYCNFQTVVEDLISIFFVIVESIRVPRHWLTYDEGEKTIQSSLSSHELNRLVCSLLVPLAFSEVENIKSGGKACCIFFYYLLRKTIQKLSHEFSKILKRKLTVDLRENKSTLAFWCFLREVRELLRGFSCFFFLLISEKRNV